MAKLIRFVFLTFALLSSLLVQAAPTQAAPAQAAPTQAAPAQAAPAQGMPPIPTELDPHCTQKLPYQPLPTDKDAVLNFLKNRKRFRLVIGAGEFVQSPKENRDFINLTAELIDKKLDDLKYDPLPTLKAKGTPFLAGVNANKQAIKDALADIVANTTNDDIAIIYYLGHGTVTADSKDLMLSVYDRPVAEDEGIRLSEMITMLEKAATNQPGTVVQIPHFIIVLETCYSGIGTMQNASVSVQQNGHIRIEQIENQVVPNQIAILSSTADGDRDLSYDLKGTKMSAFGFFFLRALDQDWACADKIPDGILTLEELRSYLSGMLGQAYNQRDIAGMMTPSVKNDGHKYFIAYNPELRVIDGERTDIVQVFIQPDPNRITEVRVNGARFTCYNSTPCSFPTTKSNSTMQIQTTVISEPTQSWLGKVGSVFAGSGNPATAELDLSTVRPSQQLRLAGTAVTIQ